MPVSLCVYDRHTSWVHPKTWSFVPLRYKFKSVQVYGYEVKPSHMYVDEDAEMRSTDQEEQARSKVKTNVRCKTRVADRLRTLRYRCYVI